MPTLEVKFKGITVDAEVYKGNRALPTIVNGYRNVIEVMSIGPSMLNYEACMGHAA